jgi:hypothetical protein
VSKTSFKLSAIPLAASGGCYSVPKWCREQLLACGLPLHYVSLSWLLRYQYRYQHEQQLCLATYGPLVDFPRVSKWLM